MSGETPPRKVQPAPKNRLLLSLLVDLSLKAVELRDGFPALSHPPLFLLHELTILQFKYFLNLIINIHNFFFSVWEQFTHLPETPTGL